MKFFIIRKRKAITSLILILALIAVIFVFKINNNAIKTIKINFCSTNEDRIAFLNSYGWEVNEEPFETKTIIIPVEFNKIYENYNELQLTQGFNLEAYKGQTVKKYTYTINNYPKERIAYSTLYIYENKIIAGDVYTPGISGIMHGLSYPNIKAG